MLSTGITLTALSDAPHHLGLELVHAQSVSDTSADLAVAARDLLAESAAQLDSSPHGPTATLLALTIDSRTRPLKDRRRAAAEQLYVSLDHFRREREPSLLEAAADHLYARDSAYRRRRLRETQTQTYDPRLGIDWLTQHRTYLRIWTPVAALRADLLRLLDLLRDVHQQGQDPYTVDADTRHWISDRLATMAWRLAQFSQAMRDFVDEQGGLWLLSDPTKERDLAHAVWEIEAQLPFGEGDLSWLRLLLADARDGELEPFTNDLIADTENRPPLMAAWIDWVWQSVRRAHLEERPPLELEVTCEAWLWAAASFVELVESDWSSTT